MKVKFKNSVKGTPFTLSFISKKGKLNIMFYPLVFRRLKGKFYWDLHIAAPTLSITYTEGKSKPLQIISDDEMKALCWQLKEEQTY